MYNEETFCSVTVRLVAGATFWFRGEKKVDGRPGQNSAVGDA